MSLWGSIADIANKLLPNQKRRDINRLKELEKLYAQALQSGQDTDAAIYRKEMKKLREIMGYSEMD